MVGDIVCLVFYEFWERNVYHNRYVIIYKSHSIVFQGLYARIRACTNVYQRCGLHTHLDRETCHIRGFTVINYTFLFLGPFVLIQLS